MTIGEVLGAIKLAPTMIRSGIAVWKFLGTPPVSQWSETLDYDELVTRVVASRRVHFDDADHAWLALVKPVNVALRLGKLDAMGENSRTRETHVIPRAFWGLGLVELDIDRLPIVRAREPNGLTYTKLRFPTNQVRWLWPKRGKLLGRLFD